MKKVLALVVVLASIFGSTVAEADENTSWSLSVNNGFTTSRYDAGNGGKVDVGLRTCVIGQPTIFKTNDGTRLEAVNVTCDWGISGKVMLSTACNASGSSSSIGMLQVQDSLRTYTITLVCRN